MKSNQPLTLALSEAELDLLQVRRKKPPGEWVFPGEGRTGHYVEPKRALARLLNERNNRGSTYPRFAAEPGRLHGQQGWQSIGI